MLWIEVIPCAAAWANPRFKTVSVVRVDISADLRFAHVLVSSFLPDADDVIAELVRARGQIKQLLAKKMVMRYIPELEFVKDSGFAMDQTLSRLKKETNDD